MINYYETLQWDSNFVLHFLSIVSLVMNCLLTRIPTEDEPKHAFFNMKKMLCFEPRWHDNIMIVEFYQTHWDLVKSNVVMLARIFFQWRLSLKHLNATFFMHIPKVLALADISQYLSITCINVIYNRISKVLANRLARVLPLLVSKR